MRFNWNLLGYAFCRVWQAQIFVFLTSATDSKLWMASFWLAAAIALAVLMPFLFTRKTLRAARSWIIVLAAGLSAGGVLFLLIGSLAAITPLFAVGTVCSGAGLALLWLAWADRFSVLSNRNIYLYTVCDTALMIAINLIGNVFPSAQSTVELLVVLCPIASLVLLLRDWKKDGTWLGEGGGSAASNPLMAKRNLVGLCVVMFFFPFAYHISIVSIFSNSSFLGRDGGDIVALVIFAIILKLTKEKASLVTVYRIAIPLVLGGFLLCCVLPAQAAAANVLVAGGGFKLASLFFWVLLLFAVPNGKSRWIVLASGLAAKFLGNSAALFLDELLPPSTFADWNDLIAMAVIIVVLMGIIVWTLPGKFDAAGPGNRPTAGTAAPAGEALEALCQGISEEYRLTKRESEVFLLLAQGRNEGAIAEMLSVGRGTAHSHILHIYQKLGVHGQQELISFVHGE